MSVPARLPSTIETWLAYWPAERKYWLCSAMWLLYSSQEAHISGSRSRVAHWRSNAGLDTLWPAEEAATNSPALGLKTSHGGLVMTASKPPKSSTWANS